MSVEQDAADRAMMQYEAMAFKWVEDHGIDKVIDHIAKTAGPRIKGLAQAIHGLVTQAWIEGADSGFQARKALHEATKEELAELEADFDLRWNADMRAIKRWRKAHPGKELCMPDQADLCVWLLEQMP